MNPQAAELLCSCELTPLFIDILGWERNTRPLPVTIVEIGVACPRTLEFRLTGVAQKRGAQIFLCPPDEYGRILSQTTRRLIQYQVRSAAHHNVVVFTDATCKIQVWQFSEQRAGERSMRVYEHRISNKAQATNFIARLTAITFSLREEAQLTLVDVVRRLKAAFSDGHRYIQRGGWRDGLAAYDLAEMDEGLRFWWEQVLREPRLTRKEEYRLACAMRNGDAQALDKMLRLHLHLIARIAWREVGGHKCPPTDYLDLVQTGNVEMIRLAAGFDPDGGVRFQTYLTPRILKTLRRVLAGEEDLIPIPRYILETMPRIAERRDSVEDSLTQKLGRTPFECEVTEQLAADYQASQDNVARVLLIRDGIESWDVLKEDCRDEDEDSLDMEQVTIRKPINPALVVNGDGTPSHAAVNLIRREQLEILLNKLTTRERDVVWMRFGLDDGCAHTLEEVGQRYFITRERVRQIELRAIKKLRRMGPVDLGESSSQKSDTAQTKKKDDVPEILIDSDADCAI